LVLKYYQKNKYKLLRRRWKTTFAEVDLLLLSPENRYVMVEVKSLHSTDFLPHRLSWKQKGRLQKVIESFSSKNLSVCFHLAVVDKADQVLIFDSIFG
jgi:Holliday junction resolvase-like predicted endonuclease